jgi:hypothetical protein
MEVDSKRAEAAAKISQALRVNLLVRRALSQKLQEEFTMVQRILRKYITRARANRNSKNGLLSATIYFEDDSMQFTSSDLKIQVFGDFTPVPWSHRIDCTYDSFFRCFKADIQIKIGGQFKFIINDGERYCLSQRYGVTSDSTGCHKNNVFDPK